MGQGLEKLELLLNLIEINKSAFLQLYSLSSYSLAANS